MGMFDKLMFWKKKDELGLRNAAAPFNEDFGMQPQYGYPPPGQGFMPQPNFQQMPQMESFQSHQNFSANRDMELIAAKLDAIKAILENLNQRIANLERIAKGEDEQDNIRRRSW